MGVDRTSGASAGPVLDIDDTSSPEQPNCIEDGGGDCIESSSSPYGETDGTPNLPPPSPPPVDANDPPVQPRAPILD